jgi:hypothetical protein
MTNSPPPIIIVSGLPRSGTSMMMKMLEAGGLPLLTDGQRTADEDNPKGYYEFERVKKLKDGDFDWLPDAQGKAVKVISALLESLPQGYSFQVIFMRRLIPEILASQRKMLVNRGENPDKVSDDEMARLFEKHLAHVDAWIASQPHLQRLDVDYNLVIRDPLPAIVQVNRFLGGRLDEAAMAGVIDPSLYRQRKP